MRMLISGILTLALVGCGGPKGEQLAVIPAVGTVTLDGAPLADADVMAIPVADTPGMGGMARTDSAGSFSLVHMRGEKGLPPGTYQVKVSLRKNPDGSVPPVDDQTPEIESQAVETLPPIYSKLENSVLTFSLAADGGPIKLELKSPPKRR